LLTRGDYSGIASFLTKGLSLSLKIFAIFRGVEDFIYVLHDFVLNPAWKTLL
jgi:hypothetical protein